MKIFTASLFTSHSMENCKKEWLYEQFTQKLFSMCFMNETQFFYVVFPCKS